MKPWKLLPLLLTGTLPLMPAAAEDAPKPAEPGTLVVIDTAGKEQKLKTWKFLAGTRRLDWLDSAAETRKPEEKKPGGDEEKAPARKPEAEAAGPEALVFHEDLKLMFLPGVQTLIPLDRLRAIDFDNEMSTMTVRVAVNDKTADDVVMTGSTRYKNINKVTLEAEVDKGEAGVAELNYLGGVPRGIRGIRFPEPKVPPAPAGGRPAVVQTADGEVHKAHKVEDLDALYRLASGRGKRLPTLLFKKTLKVNLAMVKQIVAGKEESDDTVWQVQMADGDDSTLTLLPAMPVEGRPATLLGLVGRVPAGYKLFPLRRIQEIQFDRKELPPEKEPEKAKPTEVKEKE